jgi:poly[(R)-3-hydroxyalkanoate] polymerase subunit PhaE
MNHMVMHGDVDSNREDNMDDKSGERQGQANPQFATEQLTQMLNIWSDISRLPTVGPFFAYSQCSRSDLQDILDLWKTFLEFQIHLKEFWAQVNNTYTHALAKASEKAPKEYSSKKDFENFRKIVIDIFEEEFTGLFDSKDYAILNGTLLRDQYDAVMHLQKLAEKQLKVLNLPTRSELDYLSKDIHDLKKTVHDLNKNFHDFALKLGALKQNESGDISK